MPRAQALLLAEIGLLSGTAGPEQEAASRAWLGRMDADGNGTIEWAELREWWHAPGGGKATVSAARAVAKLRERVSRRKAAHAADGGSAQPSAAPPSVTNLADSADGHVAGLSKKDTHALRSLFVKHDADFSGCIDAPQLLPLHTALGHVACPPHHTALGATWQVH